MALIFNTAKQQPHVFYVSSFLRSFVPSFLRSLLPPRAPRLPSASLGTVCISLQCIWKWGIKPTTAEQLLLEEDPPRFTFFIPLLFWLDLA